MITAPTISELYTAISADFKTRFSIDSENDLKRVLTAFAASHSAMLKLFYLALMDVQKNMFPDLADYEANGGTLERHGRLKLGRNPYPATQGEYTITVTGSVGAVLPINTQFKSSADSTNPGKLFTVKETLTLASTTGVVSIIADVAGSGSELTQDDVLYSVSPITNINSRAVVSTVDVKPTDAEDMEEYRALVIQAYRIEPNGGSASDYVAWALDIDGIRTVYPYTTPGTSGIVTIYVEATILASADGLGTPTPGMIEMLWKNDRTGVFEIDPDDSQDITARGRRQLGLSDITLLPVVPQAVVVNITNLKSQTDAVKDSIESEITKMLYQKRPFVAGIGSANEKNDTLYLSDVMAAIQDAIAVGNTFDDVSVTVDGLPIPYRFQYGNIPYLSMINYD